jgi:hypothetical protein
VTETLTLTTSSANADMIGNMVTLLIGRKITFSGLTFVIPQSFAFSAEIVSDRIRLRFAKGIDVERPGFDVVLRYVDFFPSGRIFAMSTGPLGIEIVREVVL